MGHFQGDLLGLRVTLLSRPGKTAVPAHQGRISFQGVGTVGATAGIPFLFASLCATEVSRW
jgi:hypothetical protein